MSQKPKKSETKSNVDKYMQKNKQKRSAKIVTSLRIEHYNEQERAFNLSNFAITSEDLKATSKVFDEINTKAHYPTEEDLVAISKLMPGVDTSQFARFKTKSFQGTCKCGRNLSVYDIVKHAVETGTHSVEFLGDVLSGKLGNVVVSGKTDSKKVEKMFPKDTVWVENTAPIPCVSCGTLHDVSLLTPNVLHNWILKQKQ